MGNFCINEISHLQQTQQKNITWVDGLFIPDSDNLNCTVVNTLLPGGSRKEEAKQNATMIRNETERVLCSPPFYNDINRNQ